jgi:hypothetical protein
MPSEQVKEGNQGIHQMKRNRLTKSPVLKTLHRMITKQKKMGRLQFLSQKKVKPNRLLMALL